MINYDLIFMAQGIVDTIYEKEIEKCFEHFSHTSVMPFMFMLWGANQALFSPSVYHDEGDLFYYPLYNPTWLQCLYTFGSFYLVYLQVWYAKKIYNSKFNEKFYAVFVTGSMWAYLTHYVWIVIFVRWVVLPYKFDYAAAAPATFIGAETMIFGS